MAIRVVATSPIRVKSASTARSCAGPRTVIVSSATRDLAAHAREHVHQAEVALRGVGAEPRHHHAAAGHRGGREEVGGGGGVGLHRVHAALVALPGRDAEAPVALPLGAHPEGLHGGERHRDVGRRDQLALHLDLHVVAGVGRGEQERAEVLARDVAAHARAAARDAARPAPPPAGSRCPRGSPRPPRARAGRRAAAGSGACASRASRPPRRSPARGRRRRSGSARRCPRCRSSSVASAAGKRPSTPSTTKARAASSAVHPHPERLERPVHVARVVRPEGLGDLGAPAGQRRDQERAVAVALRARAGPPPRRTAA